MDGWTNERTDGCTDGRTDARTDGRTDGRYVEEWTRKPCRDGENIKQMLARIASLKARQDLVEGKTGSS